MVDPVDETYRRTVTRQLKIGESRHSLARKILHGLRGDIMQPYRAGQEDQLGALAHINMLGRYTFPPVGRAAAPSAARPGRARRVNWMPPAPSSRSPCPVMPARIRGPRVA